MVNIKEYKPELALDLKALFTELQIYEKEIWPERAEPTPEYIGKLDSDLLTDVNSKRGKVFIAYEGDVAVGFIAGYIEADIENDAEYFRIDSLVVTEKYRGSGVGKELMKKMEEYAKSVGQTKIGLGVLAGNTNAYKYYKKLGFKDYVIEMVRDL